MGTALLGTVALFLLMAFLPGTGLAIVSRFLPAAQTAFFVGTMLVNCVIFVEAFYLRAHKAEPFVWLSVGNAILVASTITVGEAFYGTAGMALAYFLSTFLVILPWATTILVRFRGAYRLRHGVDIPAGSVVE